MRALDWLLVPTAPVTLGNMQGMFKTSKITWMYFSYYCFPCSKKYIYVQLFFRYYYCTAKTTICANSHQKIYKNLTTSIFYIHIHNREPTFYAKKKDYLFNLLFWMQDDWSFIYTNGNVAAAWWVPQERRSMNKEQNFFMKFWTKLLCFSFKARRLVRKLRMIVLIQNATHPCFISLPLWIWESR